MALLQRQCEGRDPRLVGAAAIAVGEDSLGVPDVVVIREEDPGGEKGGVADSGLGVLVHSLLEGREVLKLARDMRPPPDFEPLLGTAVAVFDNLSMKPTRNKAKSMRLINSSWGLSS